MPRLLLDKQRSYTHITFKVICFLQVFRNPSRAILNGRDARTSSETMIKPELQDYFSGIIPIIYNESRKQTRSVNI